MTHVLPVLPYPSDALEPYFDPPLRAGCLGTRLLAEVPQSEGRLHQRLVERRRLDGDQPAFGARP
jgi:hypothetical protein